MRIDKNNEHLIYLTKDILQMTYVVMESFQQ